MRKIEATEVSICIFTPRGYNTVDQYPEDERRMYNAFVPVILDLREKWGSVPVYMDFCALTEPANQVIVAQNSIASLPAVQVFATYPDGTHGQYILQKDLSDRWAVDWTADEVRPYVESLLYRIKPSKQSLLCQIFPPLCQIGGYIWLGIAIAGGYKCATAEKTLPRLTYGAVSALALEAYFKS